MGLFRIALLALLCAAACWPWHARSDDDPVQASVSEVDAHMLAAYEQQLRLFDAGPTSLPDHAARAVARCEFIAAFSDAETGRYVDSAPDALDECIDAIAAAAPDHPIVRVYMLEMGRLHDADGQADALVAESVDWPPELRRRLATALYWELHDEREGVMATMAAQLGESPLVPRAVTHLVGTGDHAGALALLENAGPASGSHAAVRRVEAAMQLQPPGAAARELRRQEQDGFAVDAAIAARALLRAGEIDTAQERLAASTDGNDDELALARFDVAHAAGDWSTAAAAVDLVRAEGFVAHAERFARLVAASPGSLLQPALWPSLAILLVILLGLALVPGLLLIPVHYRGALRRLAGRARTPLYQTFGLRHAWMALAAVLVLPMLVLGIVAPHDVSVMLSEDPQPGGRTLMLVGLWGGLACMAALALPLARFSTAGGFGWARLHRAWWRILLAWGVLLVLGGLLAAWHQGQGTDTDTAQVRMVAELVNSGRTTLEILLAFAAVVLVGPLWEEIAFRGMLLGGIARHISFGWANLLQAVLFAVIHDDPPRFLFYLALGLLAGWLVRSTRSLGPAVVLHMLNNALAFALTLR
ncbi:CPBP family intramembrane glutamic endopeptidase [Luteimonas sp. A649]